MSKTKHEIEHEQLEVLVKATVSRVRELEDENDTLKKDMARLKEILLIKGMNVGLFSNPEALEIHQEELKRSTEAMQGQVMCTELHIDGLRCTRALGHAGEHCAHGSNGQVLRTWGEGK